MNAPPALPASETRDRLTAAAELLRSGRLAQADAAYVALLEASPRCAPAAHALARLAFRRGDTAGAMQLLRQAAAGDGADPIVTIDLAVALAGQGDAEEAVRSLEAAVEQQPGHFEAWLLLGNLREELGQNGAALAAWYRAVTGAQRSGLWIDERSTPPRLLSAVTQAIARIRDGRRELFLGSYDDLRQRHGAAALQRVDRAIAGYLRETADGSSPDPRQRPRFLYFPGLPPGPYHDPMAQPWAPHLVAAFQDIRAEALAVLHEPAGDLQPFVETRPGDRMNDFVAGSGERPAWDAFFFYRHGQRFDAHHRRCPKTSATLESIELCRIDGQAPEICFSVMAPGTHILPHYGTTNTRLVMHLPLLVPAGCALNVIDAGEHAWIEGQPMMFDDTFQHEAWNRSALPRVVLLMDCWSPYLTPVEKDALRAFVGVVNGLRLASRQAEGGTAGA